MTDDKKVTSSDKKPVNKPSSKARAQKSPLQNKQSAAKVAPKEAHNSADNKPKSSPEPLPQAKDADDSSAQKGQPLSSKNRHEAKQVSAKVDTAEEQANRLKSKASDNKQAAEATVKTAAKPAVETVASPSKSAAQSAEQTKKRIDADTPAVVAKKESTIPLTQNKVIKEPVVNAGKPAQAKPVQDKAVSTNIDAKAVEKSGKESAAQDTVATTNVGAVAVPAQKQGGKGLAVTALLFSMGALGAGGYAAYQTSLDTAVASQSLSGLNERIQMAVADSSEVKSSMGGLDARVAATQTELTQNVDALKASVAAFDQRVGTVEGSVGGMQQNVTDSLAAFGSKFQDRVKNRQIQELRSLLSMVGQHYRWTGDIATTVSGLSEADKAIVALNDPALDEVRAQLASEISALQATDTLDITRTHNQLSALVAEVKDLAFKQDELLLAQSTRQFEPKTAENTQPPNDDSSASGWFASSAKSLLNDLGGGIKVTDVSESLEGSLTREGKFTVAENLRLKLLTAQAALVRSNQAIYDLQIEAAKQLVMDYYLQTNADVTAWLAELGTLTAAKLVTELPDVSGSLVTLDNAINARVN